MKTSLPLFYFKPSVCWIDDDKMFMEAARISFGKHYRCITLASPSEAVGYFNTWKSPLSKINTRREFSESDVFGTKDHYPVDINLASLKTLSGLAARHEEIAVVVVDYNMPDCNGIDLCRLLGHIRAKKILLTGDATHERAVEAFNQGLIDRFVRKDHDTYENIKKCIDDLIFQYFIEQTAGMLSHLEVAGPSMLSDENFIRLYKSWCAKHNISEFYLVNRQGTFFAKDSQGKQYYFVAMSETDKNEFVRMNDELSDTAGELLESVSSGVRIPFFGEGRESWELDVVEWERYFHPAQMIAGNENYYWAVIEVT